MPNTSAIKRFNKMHDEAEKMLPSGSSGKVDSVNAHKCRLAIVYGVAAMDAYFTRKFMDYLTGYLKGMSKRPALNSNEEVKARKKQDDALEAILDEAGLTPSFYRGQFEADKPYRKIYSNVSAHLLVVWTTQRFNRIDELFKVYGVYGLSGIALNKAKGNLVAHGRLIPKKRIEKMVTRRNEIVHECDMNDASRLQATDRDEIEQNLDVIKEFVRAADEVINGKMKPSRKAATSQK